MERKVIVPRPDLQEKALWDKVLYVEENALQWSECEYDWYWNEEGQVVLSQDADKQMLEATFQLHNMMLVGVDKVVKDDKLLKLFGINK